MPRPDLHRLHILSYRLHESHDIWPRIRGFLSNSLATFMSMKTSRSRGFDARQKNAGTIQALRQDTAAFQAETGRMNAQIIPAHPFGQCYKRISFETVTSRKSRLSQAKITQVGSPMFALGGNLVLLTLLNQVLPMAR